MSTAVKEKKPFLPQRKASAPANGGAVALRGSGGRPTAGLAVLTIGGEPRVHLLPQEVTERKKVKELKRRLLLVAVLVVAVVAVAYGLATFALTAAQAQLDGAHNATAQLLVEQSKFGAVTKINSDIASIQQSQKTATAQEILWAPYLASVEQTLPSDASITAVSAQMDTPFGTAAVAAPPTTVPLQGPRIATLQLTVVMAQSEIPGWLNELPSLKGFVDATPDSVTAVSAAGGSYTVVATIHINGAAISQRFSKNAGGTK
jgi:hypothetical protein